MQFNECQFYLEKAEKNKTERKKAENNLRELSKLTGRDRDKNPKKLTDDELNTAVKNQYTKPDKQGHVTLNKTMGQKYKELSLVNRFAVNMTIIYGTMSAVELVRKYALPAIAWHTGRTIGYSPIK